MRRPSVLALVVFAVVALQVFTSYNLAVIRTRWDPFDRTVEARMQEPPVCLISRWCSTGVEDPEFPCTEIIVTTCPTNGETPAQLRARHKADVKAQLAEWPKNCDDCR